MKPAATSRNRPLLLTVFFPGQPG